MITNTTKREKIKGHYRNVTRDDKGRFVTSTKWSSKKKVKDIKTLDQFIYEYNKIKEDYQERNIVPSLADLERIFTIVDKLKEKMDDWSFNYLSDQCIHLAIICIHPDSGDLIIPSQDCKECKKKCFSG